MKKYRLKHFTKLELGVMRYSHVDADVKDCAASLFYYPCESNETLLIHRLKDFYKKEVYKLLVKFT